MVATGYNITCDAGDLYNRKCYVTNPTTGAKEEIIGYTSSGDPISKGASTSSWLAWVPSLTSLDLSGNPYQPYGQAGIPYTKTGSAIGAYMPSSGSDSQDFYYLNEVMPGSQSRKMYQKRVCNPLWPTFGCRTGDFDESSLSTASEGSQGGSDDAPDYWKPALVLSASIVFAGILISGFRGGKK